jgi:hypothetical protein
VLFECNFFATRLAINPPPYFGRVEGSRIFSILPLQPQHFAIKMRTTKPPSFIPVTSHDFKAFEAFAISPESTRGEAAVAINFDHVITTLSGQALIVPDKR